ncbi:MAG: FAD-binding oxidoreductase [Burkholderiaceae bacterium]|nr:FAD-binding oxidoreductase [Burkholderiaceae bacterium]
MSTPTLIARLVDLLGESAVLRTQADMAGYTEDWRGRYKGQAACVVLPASVQQVSDVVRLCTDQGVPILPQGGNTSLCGGAVPDANGTAPVIINLSRMNRIRNLDAANNSIEVEAGCVLATVQQAAAEQGRLYAVSLGAEGSCQIGGNIATNAGGTGVLRYGNTRENVLGLEVVLPDGSIWNGLKTLRKDNTGLDLKHLFIGTEGTLGVITAATLKLHPLPLAHSMAWVAPVDPKAALALLGRCQARFGAKLTAFEMIDSNQMDIVLEYVPGRRNPLAKSYPWHLLIELSDSHAVNSDDDELLELLDLAMTQGLVADATLATSQAQRHAMWELRHSVSEGNKKAGVGLTSDTAVPVSAVPQFIHDATAAVQAIVPGLKVVIVAHLGDGNVHFIPFFSFDQWQALADQGATAQAIRRSVNDVAHSLGGTFSAEHGVGRTLLPEMQHYKSPVELAMMHAVKQALDPGNLLNPGRLLP